MRPQAASAVPRSSGATSALRHSAVTSRSASRKTIGAPGGAASRPMFSAWVLPGRGVSITIASGAVLRAMAAVSSSQAFAITTIRNSPGSIPMRMWFSVRSMTDASLYAGIRMVGAVISRTSRTVALRVPARRVRPTRIREAPQEGTRNASVPIGAAGGTAKPRASARSSAACRSSPLPVTTTFESRDISWAVSC